MKECFVIGSRGSELALWQANFVKTRLEQVFPGSKFEISTIKTTGDQMVDTALSKIGDKGLFTRQIETALLNGDIDLAVHSLKDLQTAQPEGLAIGAICERGTANDAFISKSGGAIDDLGEGARVATGSLRRKSQLLNYRPDLKVEEIRGNVPTRLRKFDEAGIDGIVLAFAGLQRLELQSRVTQLIPYHIMLPAVGQGAVAVEIRAGDRRASAQAAKLDHAPTRICAMAERAFLRRLEGGCQVPIGALASWDGKKIVVEGMVGSVNGRVIYRDKVEANPDEAESAGVRLAEKLVECGAGELLAKARTDAETAAKAVL